MVDILKGEDITMLADDKSVYHAQSHEVSIAPEFEEYETKDTNGKKKEFSGKKITVNVNGLACVKKGEQDVIDAPDLIASALAGKQVTLLLRIALDGTNVKTYSMEAWVTSMDITAEVAKRATYKASYEGYNLEPVTE